MAVTTTQRRVDYVIVQIADNIEHIENAHDRLGIPLREVLFSIIEKALRNRCSDSHQPTLFPLKDNNDAQADQQSRTSPALR